MPLLFFHEPSNPLLSFFFHNQMMCCCDSVACTQCAKGEGWGVLRNGQKAGGLSLRVKRDERVGGLVVGWGGCVCHGLVSIILSLSSSMSVTSTHPSMVSHSPVCFKADVLLPLQSVCWCCCVVPLFAPLSNPLLICHFHLCVACTMSCVCVLVCWCVLRGVK